jgi:hypothetical protein
VLGLVGLALCCVRLSLNWLGRLVGVCLNWLSSLLFFGFGRVVCPTKLLLSCGCVVLCFPLNEIHAQACSLKQDVTKHT